MNLRQCPHCSYYMQYSADPSWPFHQYRYFKCVCGYTVETGEYMDKKFIKLEDWITSSGKYPERAKSPELTQEVKDNASRLLDKVNQYLHEIKYTKEVKVSSGFRPSAVNAAIGGAKKSAHMSGLAIDLEDLKEEIDNANKLNATALRKFGLFYESPDHTKNWSHIDMVVRKDRPSRMFIP